ncbi:MAG: dihydroneopterin aldolase [bacterium]
MSDLVYIKGLEVETIIGVFDWEQRVRQRLVIDLEMQSNFEQAAKSDALSNTLDYGAISERLTEATKQSRFKLLESLAERLAAILQDEFGISSFTLSVSKPGAVSNAETVGVRLIRGEPS